MQQQSNDLKCKHYNWPCECVCNKLEINLFQMQTQQPNNNLKCICSNWRILKRIEIQITFAEIKLDALEVGHCRLKSFCSNWPLTSKMHYLHQYNYRIVFDDQLSFSIRRWYHNQGLKISYFSYKTQCFFVSSLYEEQQGVPTQMMARAPTKFVCWVSDKCYLWSG